jgi:hypothetical protein
MMQKLDKAKSRRVLVNLKIYFDRARMYLGYINFFMLNLVLINSYDSGTMGKLLNEHQLIVIPGLILFYFLLLLIIGYLDTRFGFRQEEMRNNALNNPILMKMVSSIEEIEKELVIQRKNK